MPIPKHDTLEVEPQPSKYEDMLVGSFAILSAIIAVSLIFLKR